MKRLFFAIAFTTLVNASETPTVKHKRDLTEEETNKLVEHQIFMQCSTNYSQAAYLKSSDASEKHKTMLKQVEQILDTPDCQKIMSLVVALYKFKESSLSNCDDSHKQREEKLREYLKD